MPQGFLIGATEKAKLLDDRMKVLFEEHIIRTGPDEYAIGPGSDKAVIEGFNRIWRDVGQSMTPVKLTILAILLDNGPTQLDDLFGAVQEDKPTGQKTFTSAVKQLLAGDLVTMNKERMLGPG